MIYQFHEVYNYVLFYSSGGDATRRIDPPGPAPAEATIHLTVPRQKTEIRQALLNLIEEDNGFFLIPQDFLGNSERSESIPSGKWLAGSVFDPYFKELGTRIYGNCAG